MRCILTFQARHWPQDRSSNDLPASPRRRGVPESVHGDHSCPAPPAHIIDIARFDPQLPCATAAKLPFDLKSQAEGPLALNTDDLPHRTSVGYFWVQRPTPVGLPLGLARNWHGHLRPGSSFPTKVLFRASEVFTFGRELGVLALWMSPLTG